MIGEILDEKYEIEKELGRGGMGIVYLATHVGTGRFVAVKVILPEFIRNSEFIERFRREARAAGRLRHPNVVDVTDFGIAKTSLGNVAYLVMEYLDGCTLAEVLEEEKRLPLSWTVDILEQVCSAVHQAHQQGVIHRDLKPENIWLEPNKRGGYNVKVLDFGIAKLEENTKEEIEESFEISDVSVDTTNPVTTEKTTILLKQETSATDADFSEKATALFSGSETKQKAEKINSSSLGLTRAGVVLGTPLYMSPEQCRGEKLDARSDIYSLGVIAYRMLSGKVPFDGSFAEVIKAHQEKQPPPLEEKGIPRAVKEVISSALAKKPEDRPQTAQAFGDKLRTASEGIGELLRKSLIIYGEQFPRLIFISFLALLPGFLIHTLEMIFGVLSFFNLMKHPTIPIGFIDVILQQVSWAMLSGITTLIVAHHLILPLRPINLSSFFSLVISRIKPLFLTVFTVSVLWWIGIIFCLVPGFIVSVLLLLAPCIVVIEKVNVRQALKRSVELVKRSYRTAVAVVLFSTIIPVFFSVFLGIFSGAVVKAYMPTEKAQNSQGKNERADAAPENYVDGLQVRVNIAEDRKSKEILLRKTIVNSIFQVSFMLILVFLVPFLTVLTVLFYFKMRFAGGESLQDLAILFEELEVQKPEWQKRIQARQLSLDRIRT